MFSKGVERRTFERINIFDMRYVRECEALEAEWMPA
jgi:hypothetical protein